MPAPGSPIAVGPRPGEPGVGDCNGDGNQDIIVPTTSRTDPPRGQLAILLGEGSGRFRPAPSSPFSFDLTGLKVALGDVNRDGNLDALVVQHDSDSTTILLGDGRGQFRPAPGSPVTAHQETHPHTHSINLGDLNADGRLDAVTTNADDNSVSVLLGDGTAHFTPAAGSPFPAGRHPYEGVALQDFNGDGTLDLGVPNTGATP